MDFSADLPAHYAIFGASVTYTPVAGGASVTDRAIHTHPGTIYFGSDAMVTQHTLRYQASSFPSVKKGDVFLVFGVSYIVTDPPLTTQDGLEFIATLARTP